MQLHHIAMRTQNPNYLAAFYVEALGMVIVKRQAHSIWLGLGLGRLMIEQAGPDEPAIDGRTMEMFALRIDPSERDAFKARLAGLNVAIEGETECTTYFRDPDGRRVGISSYAFEG